MKAAKMPAPTTSTEAICRPSSVSDRNLADGCVRQHTLEQVREPWQMAQRARHLEPARQRGRDGEHDQRDGHGQRRSMVHAVFGIAEEGEADHAGGVDRGHEGADKPRGPQAVPAE